MLANTLFPNAVRLKEKVFRWGWRGCSCVVDIDPFSYSSTARCKCFFLYIHILCWWPTTHTYLTCFVHIFISSWQQVDQCDICPSMLSDEQHAFPIVGLSAPVRLLLVFCFCFGWEARWLLWVTISLTWKWKWECTLKWTRKWAHREVENKREKRKWWRIWAWIVDNEAELKHENERKKIHRGTCYQIKVFNELSIQRTTRLVWNRYRWKLRWNEREIGGNCFFQVWIVDNAETKFLLIVRKANSWYKFRRNSGSHTRGVSYVL